MNIFSKLMNYYRLMHRYFTEAEYSASKRNITFRHIPHFYSPLTDLKYIEENQNKIFNNTKSIKDININDAVQRSLLEIFNQFQVEMPFKDECRVARYQFNNDFFSYGDATVLYSFMRYLKPKKIIEVGSGYSSAAMLDIDDLGFFDPIEFTFIEPFTERLEELLKDNDTTSNIIQDIVQNVPVDKFSKLEENDILFIDSSHVSKTGSDINYLLFEVFPSLAKGVYIHIHDIFWPFEYPKSWVLEGRCWTEIYLIRAFLQNNQDYQIQFFNSYLHQEYDVLVKKYMPTITKNPGGSLWLKKIA